MTSPSAQIAISPPLAMSPTWRAPLRRRRAGEMPHRADNDWRRRADDECRRARTIGGVGPSRARRRRSGALQVVVGLLLLVAGIARAQPAPVEVTTSVEPKTVTIGTPFRYTMHFSAEKEIELIVPQLAGRIGDFEVLDFGHSEPREVDGRIVFDRWFTLLTYQAGDALVPGPTVQYRVPGSDLERVAAPDALVIVESLIDVPGATPVSDIRDIKAPLAPPRDYRPLLWLAAAAAAVIALAAGLFLLLNRRRRRAAVAAPRPAHEIALEALGRLHAARLVDAGRHEEFYVRLSGIVRTYLEARFHLRAPEMTTEEFLQAAQRDPQLTPAHRSALGAFLSEADLVKFARYVPAAADAERAFRAAREFVQSSAPPEVRDAAA